MHAVRDQAALAHVVNTNAVHDHIMHVTQQEKSIKLIEFSKKN
jgi:hypothetical protein